MTCDLPVDLIVADICVGSSLGLYILIVIGFAIFGWIVEDEFIHKVYIITNLYFSIWMWQEYVKDFR